METDYLLIIGIIFVGLIPMIPGALLWFFLHPVTFWEKLAWFVVSLILYYIVLRWELVILER